MDVKPLELSRYCVPYTPFSKKLEDSSVCLVTTAGVRMKDDAPFKLEGDHTFRTVPSDATTAQLTYDDSHYDHECIDKDLNCVFPIDRLAELAHEGRISGLAEKHFSLGFSQALRELREKTIPHLVSEIDKVRPDIVLLTGG